MAKRNSKIEASGHRSRGRPINSKKVPPDLDQCIWVAVEVQRWRMRNASGCLGDISQACRDLACLGGINFIVGGDIKAISRAVKSRRSSNFIKALRRVEPQMLGERVRLVNSPRGPIFLRHSIQEATSLRARYNEAAQQARSNHELKKFWSSIVQQEIGLPRQSSDA